MGSRREVLATVLRYINFTEDNVRDEFCKRFFIQKWIYLLQEWKGYSWNYSYNVYLSGPYSPALSKDVYSIIDSRLISSPDIDVTSLPNAFCNDLDEIKEISTDRDLLEALTTLIFIGKRYGRNYKQRKHDIFDRFKSVKPFISDNVRDSAWNIIEDKSILGN